VSIFNAITLIGQGTASEKLDLFAMLRGRSCFTPRGPLLVYATGGFAFGHVSATTAIQKSSMTTFSVSPSLFRSPPVRRSLCRLTVGGGLEWMFAPQWTLKGEYLYYDLAAFELFVTNGAGFNVNSTATVKGNIARIGVNYKF